MQVWLVAAACAAACADTTVSEQGARQEPLPLEVEVAHARETLTRGRGEWTETSVRITHREGPNRMIYLQGRHLHRFGVDDGDLTLGTVFPLVPRWTLALEAGFSPSPVFLPEWQAAGGVSYAPGGGWVLGYGLRYLEYTAAPTIMQQGTVDRYIGAYLVGYTLTHANVRGAGEGIAHTGRASRFYGAGSNVTLAATAGRSVEAVAPDDVRVIGTQSVGLWGVHWLDGGTGLAWAVGWHRHGDLFERSGLRLGVRQRL